MAVYQSKYAELTFYVDGQPRKFVSGRYKTENTKEIGVLNKITDAIRIDTPKTASKTEPNQEPERKQTAKTKSKRK